MQEFVYTPGVMDALLRQKVKTVVLLKAWLRMRFNQQKLITNQRTRWSVAMQFAPRSGGVISSSGVVVKSKNTRSFYFATSKL